MSQGSMKILLLCGLLATAGSLHAQQPGVNCAPIQGQGWTGCAPINPSQPSAQGQQPQMPKAPPQRWQDHWGAIVTDPVKSNLGTAVNMTSQSEAEQAALADCQGKGGTACKQDIAYRNQCAAMVVGDTGYDTKAGATVNDAVQAAMKVCNTVPGDHCHSYYTACSQPVRIQ